MLTSGSIAAARGKKNVGERVWKLILGAGWEPTKWPNRPDNLDLASDMVVTNWKM